MPSKKEGKLNQLELFEARHYINKETLYKAPYNAYFALLYGNKAKNKKYRQKIYEVEQLSFVLKNLYYDWDNYISQGIFYRPNRRIVNLWSVGLCYVDLDTYKVKELQNIPTHTIIDLLFAYCELMNIPEPSLVIYSGNGIYLKWLFEKAVPKGALPRWNAVQKKLVELFKDFGADPQARDASRVLRIPGTTNTKTGLKVEIVIEKPDIRYDFEKFSRQILPLERPEKVVENAKIVLPPSFEKKTSGKPYKSKFRQSRKFSFTPAQLWWDRLQDIRTYVKLRWKGRVPEGYRDIVLFLSYVALGWIEPVNTLVYGLEFEQLIKEYGITMPRKEIFAYMSTAKKRLLQMVKDKKEGKEYDPSKHLYLYRTKTIIEMLDIQPEYQQYLKTLVSSEIQKERDKEYQREKRRKQGVRAIEEYLEERKKNKELLRAEVKLLRSKGLSIKQIAKELGIHYTYVSKLLRG